LLAIDLRAAGWKLAHAPHVVAHHAPESGDHGRRRRSGTVLRNRLLIALMRRPAPVAARELGAFVRAVWREPGWPQVLLSLIRRLPRALVRRRRVPPAVEHELELVGA
jgi:hypothetical protein